MAASLVFELSSGGIVVSDVFLTAKEAHYAYKYLLVLMQGERRHPSGRPLIDAWDAGPLEACSHPPSLRKLRFRAVHVKPAHLQTSFPPLGRNKKLLRLHTSIDSHCETVVQ